MDPLVLSTILGLLGAGASGLGSWAANRDKNKTTTEQISNRTPLQNESQDLALQNAMKFLSQPGGGFGPIEDEENARFAQETQPGIAERFNATFGPGNTQGSGHEQFQTQAKQDFGRQLAAMKANFQNNQLSGLLNYGGGNRFDTLRKGPEDKGGLTGLLENLGGTIGPTLGNLGTLYANKAQNDQNKTGMGNNEDNYSKILQLLNDKGLQNKVTSDFSNGSTGSTLGQQLNNFRSAGF